MVKCSVCGKVLKNKKGAHGHLRMGHNLSGEELEAEYESTLETEWHEETEHSEDTSEERIREIVRDEIQKVLSGGPSDEGDFADDSLAEALGQKEVESDVPKAPPVEEVAESKGLGDTPKRSDESASDDEKEETDRSPSGLFSWLD